MFSCCSSALSYSLNMEMGDILQHKGMVAELLLHLDGFYLNESSDFLYLTAAHQKRILNTHLPETLEEVDPMRVQATDHLSIPFIDISRTHDQAIAHISLSIPSGCYEINFLRAQDCDHFNSRVTEIGEASQFTLAKQGRRVIIKTAHQEVVSLLRVYSSESVKQDTRSCGSPTGMPAQLRHHSPISPPSEPPSYRVEITESSFDGQFHAGQMKRGQSPPISPIKALESPLSLKSNNSTAVSKSRPTNFHLPCQSRAHKSMKYFSSFQSNEDQQSTMSMKNGIHSRKLIEDPSLQMRSTYSQSFSNLPRGSQTFSDHRLEAIDSILGRTLQEHPGNQLKPVDQVASNCSVDDEVRIAFNQTFSAKTPLFGAESTCSFKLSKTRNIPIKLNTENNISPGPLYRPPSPDTVSDIEISPDNVRVRDPSPSLLNNFYSLREEKNEQKISEFKPEVERRDKGMSAQENELQRLIESIKA